MQLQFKSAYIFLISLLVVFAGGCTSNPVYNVESASVITGKTDVSMDEVKKAIIRAGGTLGWSMNAVSLGHVIGTLKLRKHVAVVDIKYDTKTYSIMYKDSTNLGYDGKNIHRNYNGWVQNLNNAIRVQLNTL